MNWFRNSTRASLAAIKGAANTSPMPQGEQWPIRLKPSNLRASHELDPRKQRPSVVERIRDSIANHCADKVVRWVKSIAAKEGNVQRIEGEMKRFFVRLRMMDNNGQFVPELKDYAERLMPNDLKLGEIEEFIDEIKRVNVENSNLKDLLNLLNEEKRRDLVMGPGTFAKFIDQVQSDEFREGIMPEVLGFALSLERITKLMGDDIEFVTKVVKLWESEGEKVDLKGGLPFAERVKFESILKPIKDFQTRVRKGEIESDYGNFFLPMNILEAGSYDFAMGNWDNASAARKLSFSVPGNEVDERTGAGPTRIGKNPPMVETGIDYQEWYDDNYGFWNASFCSQFESAPFLFMKLMIPSVAGYHPEQGSNDLSKPRRYIYNRVNALMAYLFSSGFGFADMKAGKISWYNIDRPIATPFSDAGFHRLGGKYALKAVERYWTAVEYAKRKN